MTIDIPRRRLDRRDDEKREEVIASIPQNSGDTTVEVVLTHNAAGSTDIELRSLVWGSGVGWYRQHTFPLDGATVRDLLHALGTAQRRLEHRVADELASNVIPFPRTRQRHTTPRECAAVGASHSLHPPSPGPRP
jgi:hypothetical protein